MDSATELGKIIGNLSKRQDTLAQSISPDESDEVMSINNQDAIIVSGTATFNKLLYATDAIIFDNTALFQFDNTNYVFDTDYQLNSPEFPLSFPIELGYDGELLYTVNF